MLAAARTLLIEEGPAAVTHQRVAQQAGVGRATAYRHWPRPDLLLLDTMATVEFPFFRDPASPVRPWLRQQLRVLADEMALPQVAAIALAMMQRGPASSLPAEVRDRFYATSFGRVDAALALAAATGELEAAAATDDALSLLVGPVLQCTCMQARAVSDALLDRIIDSIGTWHSPPISSPSALTGLAAHCDLREEQERALVAAAGLGAEDEHGLAGVGIHREGLVVQRDEPDERVVVALASADAGADVVTGPHLPELLALD
jgi:AcrR family transcriptional regulator